MSELRSQFTGALLVVLTVTAVICAGLNYQQQARYHLPDDGATWMDIVHGEPPSQSQRVTAVHVESGGPAELAGIRTGDVLLRIAPVENSEPVPIREAIDVARILQRAGVWAKTTYILDRDVDGRGVEIEAKVIVADVNRDRALYFQYAVGAAYLVIGLFIFFRRNQARAALHFYLLCLVSFVQFAFHYTGKLNSFDTGVYVANVLAGLFAPALFVHFCLIFPDAGRRWGKWKALSLYAPVIALALVQIGVATGVVRTALPLIEIRWVLDRLWLALYCGSFLAGGILLHLGYRRTEDPIGRQQLKWLRNGAFAGIVPFTLFYAAPFIAGMAPGPTMRLSVLFLAFVPLAWAYAILRYRLMDVDIIFQQGYVYVLTTVSVLAVVYLLLFALSKRDGGSGRLDELSPTAVVLLVLIAAFIFEPIRNWIQQQLDRHVFYRDHYDYRRTLIVFARELSSEMDLDRTLLSVGERLLNTLSVSHVAFFLSREDSPGFLLYEALDRDGKKRPPSGQLDLSFLSESPRRPTSSSSAPAMPSTSSPAASLKPFARPSPSSTSPTTCPASSAAAPSPGSA